MEKIKILIVDDSEITLTKIGSFLIDEKIEIYTSTSGREALHEIEKNDFSLFIIDVHMKEMDGYELAVEIKNKGSGSSFILSLRRLIRRKFKGYDVGLIDYISKGDDLAILQNKVSHLFSWR